MDKELGKQKEALDSLNLTNEIIITWLGTVDMFQTFEDLEAVKDKRAEIQKTRKLLDDEEGKKKQ